VCVCVCVCVLVTKHVLYASVLSKAGVEKQI